ncbi:MAG: ATP-dependent zinc metalloprotease FtsH [Candidatus Omnitrophica bacterium]|nr:ATP-dependent zinc metalloprotease FtsH [Candidatus Omnitrophota bacterium]
MPKGVLLVGPPGCGKCVVGDTFVFTNKGLLKIKEIPKYFFVDKNNRLKGAKTVSFSANPFRQIEEDALYWYDLDPTPTIKINTRLGLTLEGTPEHPVLVLLNNGDLAFKKLEDIRESDLLAVKYGMQVFGNLNSIDTQTAYIMGLITGDGCSTVRGRISFSSKDKELIEVFGDFFKERFGYKVKKCTERYDWAVYGQSVTDFFKERGLSFSYAKEKEVPPDILLSCKEVIVNFLKGLFDADGSVERLRGVVSLSSASKRLIEQVSLCLLNLGIVNRVYSRPKKKSCLQFHLEISSDFLLPFCNQINFRVKSKRKKLERIIKKKRNTNNNLVYYQGANLKRIWDYLKRKEANPYKRAGRSFYKNINRYINGKRTPSFSALRRFLEKAELIEPSVKNLEEFIYLKRLLDNKIYFTSVVGIERSFGRVYDFTVKKVHNFISNGFISHNTLLAKAVAGEADVPFYSISGSDFVELFVGVGASRVRDLFEQAKKAAKISGKGCIIFIDEIDAVGRLRFAGIGGGHDEREQTLNQLLVEMDGFEPNEGIIVMAATNRPDVLDPALLRPGRFDRHIVIDRPDIKGREQILKVHTKKIKLDPSVDLNSIARQTPGFSGADLANLCNEAALLAARRNKKAVGKEEMEEAIERVVAGPQRKSRIISKKEKEIVAIHESGHALLSVILPEVDPLHKVSIIPRGIGALGYTMQLPLQDRYIMTKQELFSRICVLLGGRIAENLLLKEISTGAENDLRVATDLARKMVVQFGMSPKLGHLTLERKEGPVFLGRDLIEHKDYSEETARLIDEEVKRIIDEACSKSEEIIKSNLEKLKELSQVLLEKEILEAEEVKRILKIEEENKNASPSS